MRTVHCDALIRNAFDLGRKRRARAAILHHGSWSAFDCGELIAVSRHDAAFSRTTFADGVIAFALRLSLRMCDAR